ncbi:protein BCCIP homolog [Gouania willdenowi]|uniref:Protein BCCIP homolog n=1 Tax=Gouania willdenowi TaxID=441366 RepID=A0A8C5I7R8_GOUWI|nr:BRCA2 and CDKN1A-interacting protein [Gouania willdenowi]
MLCVCSMASSAKRRAVGLGENPQENDNSSDESPEEEEEDSGEEDSEASEEEINEEVVVDFEAHTISTNDFNGIKKLLQQLFLKAHVNTSEMTDIIIQQNHVGSVIRQAEVPEDSDDDDPDEVFGFISILNLTERKGVQCVEEVKELLVDQCEKNAGQSVTKQLEQILSDTSKPVGLLLSERFLNVPPQIALPLHRQLQEEISEAQRTNKPSGKCHYILMISKTCKEATKSVPRGGEPKEEHEFVNAEEEFFFEQAIIKFHYSVQEEADSCLSGRWSFDDVPMKPFRTVMLIPSDKMPAIMDRLKEYLTV